MKKSIVFLFKEKLAPLEMVAMGMGVTSIVLLARFA